MTTSFTLYCLDKEKGKGEWRFESHESGMNVFDPDHQLVFWFAHEQAAHHLAPPSFWLDQKNIVLTTDKGTAVAFRPDPEDVRVVKQYLDDAVVRSGPASLGLIKVQAGCGLIGGLVVTLLCLAVVVVVGVLDLPGAKWWAKPFAFGAIGGLAMFGAGIFCFFRYRRLSRRYAAEKTEA